MHYVFSWVSGLEILSYTQSWTELNDLGGKWKFGGREGGSTRLPHNPDIYHYIYFLGRLLLDKQQGFHRLIAITVVLGYIITVDEKFKKYFSILRNQTKKAR